MRATARVLLISMSLCVSAAFPALADQPKIWTWKDMHGKLRSRADLDEILKRHLLWLKSGRQSGSQATLGDALLEGADLGGADLTDADLGGANLSHAKLTFTDLIEANLSGANLSGANLRHADLSHADLTGADLGGADLSLANLSDAGLRFADLGGADLSEADLSDSDLSRADLSEAILWLTVVGGTTFEPTKLPDTGIIATAKELWLMRYVEDPTGLTQLRKIFQDDGFRTQEREITYALNRHDADPSALRASIVEKWKSISRKPFEADTILSLRSFIEGTFKWVAFDLTCQYGMSYGRPLRIVGLLWLLCTAVYAVFIHWPGSSGIYLVGTRLWRGKSNTQAIQIRPEPLPAAKWWKVPFLWFRREWRVLRAAMFFSLMSAFNIGFRDINFGRWLRLLTKREYDLKAVGWARTVSGFQSLLSVYLIALWVLTYFGRPFG